MPRRSTRNQSGDDSDPSIIAMKAPQRIYQVDLLPADTFQFDNCADVLLAAKTGARRTGQSNYGRSREGTGICEKASSDIPGGKTPKEVVLVTTWVEFVFFRN